MKFLLLTGRGSLTHIEAFELHDSEHFTMSVAGHSTPLGVLDIVDEDLNGYLCVRDDDNAEGPIVSGSILARLSLSPSRVTAIWESMNDIVASP